MSSGSRPEMKGPTDVSDLLSGLKVKSKPITNVNIPAIVNSKPDVEETGSTISISELKELQNEATVPVKSKRGKQRSNKNTISLDI